MDQIQCLEAVQHLAGNCKVDVTVCGAGLCEAEREFIALVHYLVYLTLLCCELSGSGIGAGKVRCIVQVAFGTGVNHHKLSGLDNLVVEVVVKRFSVLGEDGGEGNAPTL